MLWLDKINLWAVRNCEANRHSVACRAIWRVGKSSQWRVRQNKVGRRRFGYRHARLYPYGPFGDLHLCLWSKQNCPEWGILRTIGAIYTIMVESGDRFMD